LEAKAVSTIVRVVLLLHLLVVQWTNQTDLLVVLVAICYDHHTTRVALDIPGPGQTSVSENKRVGLMIYMQTLICTPFASFACSHQ